MIETKTNFNSGVSAGVSDEQPLQNISSLECVVIMKLFVWGCVS